MSERFEIYIVYKRRYINTLPFLSFYSILTISERISKHSMQTIVISSVPGFYGCSKILLLQVKC